MNPEIIESDLPPRHPQPPQGQWTTDLFDCCHDPSLCFMTCCCPCVTFGKMAEIIDKGNTTSSLACLVYYGMSSIGCGWLYASTYRAKLRQHFSLPETPCTDWAVHCYCCLCSLSQEYRELNNRSADPSLGWQGNIEKWKREGVTPPIVASTMDR